MKTGIPAFLLQEDTPEISSVKTRKSKLQFLDKTLRTVANTVKTMYIHSETGSAKTILFHINPLVKVFSFIFLIVSISLANSIHAQLLASLFVVLFFFISGISYRFIYKKIIFLSFVFGLLVFLPASFNVITPGKIILKVITFYRPYDFWIYHVPQTIGVTDAGIRTVALLFLRVLNSISLAMIFVYCSSFSQIVKGFKVFFVPDTFLMILSLAYKYIFVLSKTIEETYFALKSKLVGDVMNDSLRKIISGRVFFIFKKSKSNYEQTYSAMISRGYTGQTILHKEKKIKFPDICFLIISVIAGFLLIFI